MSAVALTTCEPCMEGKHWKCRRQGCACSMCSTPERHEHELRRRHQAPARRGQRNRTTEYAAIKRRRDEARQERAEESSLITAEQVRDLMLMLRNYQQTGRLESPDDNGGTSK